MRLKSVGLTATALIALVVGALAFGQDVPTVRIGITPYSMYQIWNDAAKMGIDQDFGIKLELKNVAQTVNGVQLMIRGDLDVTSGTPAEHLPLVEQAPQVKNFSTVGFFKGFIFVGRQGKVTPFDQLVEQYGLAQAKEMRLKEFKGKKFAVIPQRGPLIADALDQVGLSIDDVTLLKFADDQKAAAAFIGGEGDFYMGSLPQERRLLSMGDQYVNAGGSRILGPAGLWYDTMLSTPKFMSDNRETALRTLAVWYRLVDIWDQNPDLLAPTAAQALSKLTGGDFSVDEYKTLQTQYDDFISIDEALRGFYNPNSPLYWANPVDYYINAAVKSGDLSSKVKGADYFSQSESLFYDLMSRPDLLKKIYAPVPAKGASE